MKYSRPPYLVYPDWSHRIQEIHRKIFKKVGLDTFIDEGEFFKAAKEYGVDEFPQRTLNAIYTLRVYRDMISNEDLNKILVGLKPHGKNLSDDVFQAIVYDILQPEEGEQECY